MLSEKINKNIVPKNVSCRPIFYKLCNKKFKKKLCLRRFANRKYRLRDRIHNTSFSLWLMCLPNKLLLNYTKLEMAVRGKDSSLLDRYVSYEENDVL
jgi:hypothetical protein